jgi:hypothetical protein
MPDAITKQGQNDPRKRPCESLRRRGSGHLQGLHPPPIQTCEQSLKLGRFERITPFLIAGHVKLLSSSRLYAITSPLPSQ